ncbi:hypothetical protein ASE98_15980 [Pseudomonas sp. Leaf48]|uniref:hypothetical protein n=1 Tax=Pseudomonas sp. Leaf48 TaxID=1736221 RepID=UPI00072A9510|nr:hypothetical protein [Pseudomonas sp. Leaf48]KQN54475.1 hypothetical protein ASE98_15980 [Pseudomonas sp. Leaf48]
MKKLLVLLALLSPFTAIAGEPDHFAVCDKIRSDVTRDYDVYNLVLVDKGSSYAANEELVLCVYDGTVRKFHGESAVRVMATLDIASNKLNVLL